MKFLKRVSPVLDGKGLNTKGTKYTKEEKNLDLIGFSFETFVLLASFKSLSVASGIISFVFEKIYHVKNGRRQRSHSNLLPTMSNALISAAAQVVDGYSSANIVQII